MNYIQVEFEIEEAASKEILIALLSQSGFESFEEEENILKAFIKKDEFIEDSLADILKIIPAKYTTNVIQSQNWNAQWESSFEPIVVDDFVAIRAAFHQPIKNVKHEIIITPKMSFGTGHHATTYLMIEQMAALDFTHKRVLDFGTGTAVLSILAEKMGAAEIDAIDNDDWSIENSIENLAANNSTKIKLKKADTISSSKKYDIILANINLNVILSNLPAIAGVSKKGTVILLSGFLKADEKVLPGELSKIGVSHSGTLQKGEWICLLCQVN
ncbi:MAG: 50S ribosomal protein L11 methyltransferase [Ferruginibacter sp.]